jgi:PAS domain-containing protein
MVRVALISTDKNIFLMLENEVSKYAIELVHKVSVPPLMLDKAVLNAMEDDIDLIIAYCQKPIRNVYKGVAIPVVYIEYTQSELRETVSVMAENNGCLPHETALIMPAVLLDRLLDSDNTVASDLNIILIEESGGIAGAVENAAGGETKLILGDEDVCEYAAEVGIKNAVLKPGRESIRSALALAVRHTERIRMNKRHQLELSAVMNSTFCGIIKVNPRGIIIAINNIAVNLLECKGKLVTGRYVLNIFQGLEKETLETALVNGSLVFNHIVRTKKRGYIVNIEPVIEDNEILSSIISIQVIPSSQASAAETDVMAENPGTQFRFPSFVYISEIFRNVLKKAKFAAYTDASILLTGEEGTETLEMAHVHT